MQHQNDIATPNTVAGWANLNASHPAASSLFRPSIGGSGLAAKFLAGVELGGGLTSSPVRIVLLADCHRRSSPQSVQ